MERYPVDVKGILEVTGGSLEIGDRLPLEPLVVGDETFTFTAPVAVDVTLTNTGAGVVALGTVSAEATAECARCLEPFPLHLSGEVEAFYTTEGSREGIAEEQQVEPIHDNTLDLLPAVLSALAVEAPFAPVHSEDCKGICPTCGANRNVEPCDCAQPQRESPFAVLKDLFPDEDTPSG
jgi:uncharacterized protein